MGCCTKRCCRWCQGLSWLPVYFPWCQEMGHPLGAKPPAAGPASLKEKVLRPPPKGDSYQEALPALQMWKQLDIACLLLACNFQDKALAHSTIHKMVLESCRLRLGHCLGADRSRGRTLRACRRNVFIKSACQFVFPLFKSMFFSQPVSPFQSIPILQRDTP